MVHALVPVRYPPPVEVPPDVDGEEEREEVRVAVADGGVDGGVAVLETEWKLMCGLLCILFNINISSEDDACMKTTATMPQNYGIPLHTRYLIPTAAIPRSPP